MVPALEAGGVQGMSWPRIWQSGVKMGERPAVGVSSSGARLQGSAPPAGVGQEVKNIWVRTYVAFNEILAHGTIAMLIIGTIFLVQKFNHIVDPPYGMMLLDGPPPFRVPFDWAFTIGDLGILSRFAWSGFHILRRL
jgi:hypothetical protein